jgi:hypothetical protein
VVAGRETREEQQGRDHGGAGAGFKNSAQVKKFGCNRRFS